MDIRYPTLGREESTTSSCLNQQGALGNQEFVSKEIADLLARGSIMQTDRPPLVVSPLNVVEHNGKLRLILDLVYVNYFFLLLFLLFYNEALHDSQIRQSRQYRHTAKGNL